MAIHKKDEFTLDDQSISQMAKAMSHPARITIMRILTEHPRYTCGEIVEILPLAQATVSHHLKELQDARLINIILDGKKSRYEINWHSWKDYTTSLTQFMDFVNNPADHSL
jgi:DNA-binding transcriptional ArsR family regulator